MKKCSFYVVIAVVVIMLMVAIYLAVDCTKTAKEVIEAEEIGIQVSKTSKEKFFTDYVENQYTKSNEDEKTEDDKNSDEQDLGNGEVIDFTNNGYTKYCYTYMAWQKITSKSSTQYKWRQSKFPNWVNKKTGGDPAAFDSEGFGIVDGRYVIAVSDVRDGGIGSVGQALDVYLDNGIILKCVVGDIKSNSDKDWTKWGHVKSGDTLNTVEFIVDYNTWYDSNGKGKAVNPGNKNNHPEWKGCITKIVRYN